MLPRPIAEMVQGYRGELAQHGMSWGEPLSRYVRLTNLSRFVDEETFFQAAFSRLRAERSDAGHGEHETLVSDLDFDEVLRDALAALGGEPPEGLAVLRLTERADWLEGTVRTVLDDGPLPLALLVD